MVDTRDRSVVEAFAVHAATHLVADCTVLLLLPWSRQNEPLPRGIIAPKLPGLEPDENELAEAIATRRTLLVPCVFLGTEEQEAAYRILPQLSLHDNCCLFIVQLLPTGMQASRENNEIIMRRHDAMLAIGVDDVIMNPDQEPDALRRTVNLARSAWELNVLRMQLMLEAEPDIVSPQALQHLEMQHNTLLWESIPRALMPHFRKLDRDLVETGNMIGGYRLIARIPTIKGIVAQALDAQSTSCVIKVINKAKVMLPQELEGIYREYRFLSEIVRHPHIVRCLDMLHSLSRIYLVFEFAGSHNLAQLLSERAGERLDEDEALDCFAQVVRALAHCHSKDVAHRCVSLEHIVVSESPATGRYHCRLVDFNQAMVFRGAKTSRTVCGTLPCISPEMAVGGPYVPQLSDRWSVGIVLLEMGGGLASLRRSVGYHEQAELQHAGMQILQFFRASGGHARALAYMGGVQSAAITERLKQLLRTNPNERFPLVSVMPGACSQSAR